MARAAHPYPQVDPGAAGLVDGPVAQVPAGAPAGRALEAARRRNAAVVVVGDGGFVLREDLARAGQLGLSALPAASLARALPVVATAVSEIAVRRSLAAGAAAVIVGDRGGPVGAVVRGAGRPPAASLGLRFERRLGEAGRAIAATVRRLAAERGEAAFLAGGTVRDAVRADGAAPARDLDLVVEGDGLGLARALARALGAPPPVEHRRFLTASLAGPGGVRIDVATARAERYEAPGALPRVVPATIAQDLARRDFTVNALAVELASGTFGLLDRFGGREALRRRRITVLHPLSFVEDPTRIVRAARYATRLGFALDAWTVRALRLALGLGPCPALSGARLMAEIGLVLREAHPEATLVRLGGWGAFRLLDPRYRFGRPTAARLAGLPAALERAAGLGLAVAPVELALLALLGDQPPAVAGAALRRLGLDGEPRARLERALGLAPLGPLAGPPSRRAGPLRERSDLELAWLWLLSPGPGRATVEWFAGQARSLRPRLGGEELAALGVARGPRMAALLAALRDGRLDGRLPDREAEVAFVTAQAGGERRPAPKEG